MKAKNYTAYVSTVEYSGEIKKARLQGNGLDAMKKHSRLHCHLLTDGRMAFAHVLLVESAKDADGKRRAWRSDYGLDKRGGSLWNNWREQEPLTLDELPDGKPATRLKIR